jgi:hypothetical protein
VLVYVRFASDSGIDAAQIEEAALGAIGRAGMVIGASANSVDIELSDDEPRAALQALAASLRRIGMPSSTVLDLPQSGQRFSIFDF